MDPTLASPAFDTAIRNPANANHVMVIKPVPRRIRVYRNETLLADTTDAKRVFEIGRSVYDPVVYVPKADLCVAFDPIDRSTHCPVKGDAGYAGLNGEEIAWTYSVPLEIAKDLHGLYAFWPDKVRIVEGE